VLRFFCKISLLVGLPGIILILSFRTEAKIVETDSLEPIFEAIQKSGPETLVVFDVKEVLFVAKDIIRTPKYKKEYRELISELAKRHPAAQVEKLESTILSQESLELVNPKIVDLISQSKSHGMKVIALTSGYSGKFGGIEKQEDLRLKSLQNLGIIFEDSFPDKHFIRIAGIEGKARSGCQIFKQGVVFACRAPKGKVLEEFLKQVGYKPRKIIFVDNKETNLKSVEDYVKQHAIETENFLYTECSKRPKTPVTREHILYQFDYLEKNNIWLSDKQVEEYIQKKQKEKVGANRHRERAAASVAIQK
jgi:histidinol phosphatase-like enzyme